MADLRILEKDLNKETDLANMIIESESTKFYAHTCILGLCEGIKPLLVPPMVKKDEKGRALVNWTTRPDISVSVFLKVIYVSKLEQEDHLYSFPFAKPHLFYHFFDLLNMYFMESDDKWRKLYDVNVCGSEEEINEVIVLEWIRIMEMFKIDDWQISGIGEHLSKYSHFLPLKHYINFRPVESKSLIKWLKCHTEEEKEYILARAKWHKFNAMQLQEILSSGIFNSTQERLCKSLIKIMNPVSSSKKRKFDYQRKQHAIME